MEWPSGGEIFAIVVAWVSICFIAGAIETWWKYRKYEKGGKWDLW